MSTWNLYDLIAAARAAAANGATTLSTAGQSGAAFYAAREADAEQCERAIGLAYDESEATRALLRSEAQRRART